MKYSLLALLFLLSAAVIAQPGGGPDPARKEIMEKLKLSPEQRTQMKQIYKESARQMVDLRAEMQKKRLDLSDVTDAEKPDRAKFERLSQDLAGVQVKMKLVLFDADVKIRGMLNPEQQKIWKEHKEMRFGQMRERFMQGGGRGAGRGPGGKCQGNGPCGMGQGHGNGPCGAGMPPEGDDL